MFISIFPLIFIVYNIVSYYRAGLFFILLTEAISINENIASGVQNIIPSYIYSEVRRSQTMIFFNRYCCVRE